MRCRFSFLACMLLVLTLVCASCAFAESDDYPWGMNEASVIKKMGKKGEEDTLSSPGNLLLRISASLTPPFFTLSGMMPCSPGRTVLKMIQTKRTIRTWEKRLTSNTAPQKMIPQSRWTPSDSWALMLTRLRLKRR